MASFIQKCACLAHESAQPHNYTVVTDDGAHRGASAPRATPSAMRCATCETNKPPGQFTNSQKKRPAGSRKCSACAAAPGGATANAVDSSGAEPEAPRASDDAVAAEPAAATATEPHAPAAVMPPAARVCAWSGCGRALSVDAAEQSKFKCGRCKQSFYCGRTCQKRHWSRGGHKEACVEPPCCTICLDGGDEPVPIQRGCACRGDAGLAHAACLAEVAVRKKDGCHDGWYECPTCGQPYTGAMDLGLQRALVHRLRTRRRDDDNRLIAESNLGSALRNAGLHAEAAGVLAKVLTAMKRVYGEDDAETLNTANALGCTYMFQGKLAEAEELLVAVLAAFTRLHGKEHPDTIGTTSNLAGTYRMQKRYAEAEELQVAVLEATGSVRGVEHSGTLGAADNLAITYTAQGKHAEAEELRTGALATSRRVLGAEHPVTLLAASNLAITHINLGRLAEAEELLVDTLRVSRRVRGAEHPDTLHAARGLRRTYHAQGRGAEVEELHALYHL